MTVFLIKLLQYLIVCAVIWWSHFHGTQRPIRQSLRDYSEDIILFFFQVTAARFLDSVFLATEEAIQTYKLQICLWQGLLDVHLVQLSLNNFTSKGSQKKNSKGCDCWHLNWAKPHSLLTVKKYFMAMKTRFIS